MCYECTQCGRCKPPAERVFQCLACKAWNIAASKKCKVCGKEIQPIKNTNEKSI